MNVHRVAFPQFQPQTAPGLAGAVMDNPLTRVARINMADNDALIREDKIRMLCHLVRIEAVQQQRTFNRPWTMEVVHAATELVYIATIAEINSKRKPS